MEQNEHSLRVLTESEIENVSGGKQTAEFYIPYVGTFLFFDNGCAYHMSEDLGVTEYCG